MYSDTTKAKRLAQRDRQIRGLLRRVDKQLKQYGPRRALAALKAIEPSMPVGGHILIQHYRATLQALQDRQNREAADLNVAELGELYTGDDDDS